MRGGPNVQRAFMIVPIGFSAEILPGRSMMPRAYGLPKANVALTRVAKRPSCSNERLSRASETAI